MSNPSIRIHNTETDEVIDREMTDKEFAIYELEAKSYDNLVAEKEKAVTDKTLLLKKLGITAEEAQLLLA
jgi:hypothetical protein